MEEGTPFQDSSFVCAVSVKRILSSLASRGGRGLAAAICMPEGFPIPPPFTKNQGAGSTFLRVACRCPPKKRNPSEKKPQFASSSVDSPDSARPQKPGEGCQ